MRTYVVHFTDDYTKAQRFSADRCYFDDIRLVRLVKGEAELVAAFPLENVAFIRVEEEAT